LKHRYGHMTPDMPLFHLNAIPVASVTIPQSNRSSCTAASPGDSFTGSDLDQRETRIQRFGRRYPGLCSRSARASKGVAASSSVRLLRLPHSLEPGEDAARRGAP
jgi:hypothetical protein